MMRTSWLKVALRCIFFLSIGFCRSVGEKFIVQQQCLVGYRNETNHFSRSLLALWRTFLNRSSERSHLLALIISEKGISLIVMLINRIEFSYRCRSFNAWAILSILHCIRLASSNKSYAEKKWAACVVMPRESAIFTSFNCGTRRLFSMYGVGIWNNQHKNGRLYLSFFQ